MSDITLKKKRKRDKSEAVKNFLNHILYILRLFWRKWLRWYRSKKFKLPHLLLFPLLLIYLEIILRLFAGTNVFHHLAYPILFAISAGLLLSAITSIAPKKINRILSIVLMIAITFGYGFACIVHANYQMYMSLGSIGAGANNVTSEYGYELFRAIFFGIPKIFVLYIPTILYCATGKRRMPAYRYKFPFAGMLVAGAAIFLLIGNIGAGVGKTKVIYRGTFDFNAATDTFGLVTSTRMDLLRKDSSSSFVLNAENSEEEDASTVPEEVPKTRTAVQSDNVMNLDLNTLIQSGDSDIAAISEYVNSITPSNKNEYTGLFEGKNLILICAEAFSDTVVDPELTPTLYRLTHNGIYFSEAYQPAWGGSTSTGEYSFVMGLAPVRAVQSMLDTRSNNNYFTLGNQLQREGYYSAAYHSGVYNVYNRDTTHENLGYGEYLGKGNGLEELIETDNRDTKLFDATFDTYVDKQPFSIYYMTLSGHCIYEKGTSFVNDYYDQVKARYKDQYEETTLYYFCYQMELENALTHLVKNLENAGIADETVICMTSDHYPYGLQKSDAFKTDKDYLPDLYGADYKYEWEQDHNSIIIWSGCLENEDKDMACEISEPVYTLDIVPTLSNLFGLEYDSRLLIGRDVFSDTDPLVLWNDYSWVTEQGKYNFSSGTFFPNEGYEEDSDYIDQINQIVKNKLNFSDQVIIHNYFGKLFGEDTVTDNSAWVPKASTNNTSHPADAKDDSDSDTQTDSGNNSDSDTQTDSENDSDSETQNNNEEQDALEL